MITSDKPAFVAALNELALLKPGAKLAAESYAAWWNAMQAWDIAEFRAACARLATECEFMPNPYHFEQLRKAGRMTAGEAWSAALEYARGTGDAPDDPLILEAVRSIGGFRAIAMSNTDATHFLERRFAEHFEAIRDAESIREALPQITGGSRQLKGPQPIAKLLGAQ